MNALVIGCGRVGSALARTLRDEGWDVTAIDEDEDALSRLGEDWRGGFVVGHGMDAGVLEAGGIREADAVVVATDGDNTNIVIAQVAKAGYGVPHVACRILRPGPRRALLGPRLHRGVADQDRDRGARGLGALDGRGGLRCSC